MRLACVGPISPLRTGVSVFNERLQSFLGRHCEVETFTDQTILPPESEEERGKAADIDLFLSNPKRFDAVLYHMGNHYRYHRRIYEALLNAPGFGLLHDCVLSHFFAKYYLERGNFQAFRTVMETAGSKEVESGISKFYESKADLYRFPMTGIIAKSSRGTIVMSEYGKEIVRHEAPEAKVLKISFPYFKNADTIEPEEFRKTYGIPSDHFIVTFVGHITPAKRLDVALEAFREFHARFPQSIFLIAGESSARLPVARSLKSGFGGIRYLGYLDRSKLDALIAISDACINLRYPSHGEMSSTLIDMLGLGRVAVVSNYGQFAEFPDDVCIKIAPGHHEKEDLAKALVGLSTNRDQKERMEANARAYIAEQHTPEAAAKAIMDFIKENAAAEPLLPRETSCRFLDTDPSFLRHKQAFSYNLRRIMLYAREQGLTELFKQGLRRAFPKKG
jgi:glycosyltransferase involved in cell wall biosynthesis